MKNKILGDFINYKITGKTIALFIALVMLATTVPVIAGADDINTITKTFTFSDPEIITDGETVALSMDGIYSRFVKPGAPELLAVRGAEWLPAHAQTIEVSFTYTAEENGVLPGKLSPCQIPVPTDLPKRG